MRRRLVSSGLVMGSRSYASALTGGGGAGGVPEYSQRRWAGGQSRDTSGTDYSQNSRSSPRGHASQRGGKFQRSDHASSNPTPSNATRTNSRDTNQSRSPRAAHIPQTGQDEEFVYVLTLKTTPSIADPMNRMRETWFPKHLNRTPAHLTLFHALPGSCNDSIEASLQSLSAETRPFRLSTGKPFRMRRGVGIGVGIGSKDSRAVHDRLREQWLSFLSEQDSGGWRPHWTVMNKVDEEEERHRAYETIEDDLVHERKDGKAVGLDLWKYDRGDWQWVKNFMFGENSHGPS